MIFLLVRRNKYTFRCKTTHYYEKNIYLCGRITYYNKYIIIYIMNKRPFSSRYRVVFLSVLLMSALTVCAQKARQEIKENIYRSGSNYYAYPGPIQEQLTKAPKGYVPYYISHYGRHGSRHLINNGDYDNAYKPLMRADSLGKLTAFGKDILQRVKVIRNEANLRHGELTLLGAQQHQGIGRRMYERFPEVFKGKTNIDAKSTVVIRCILSMENALQELKSLNPLLQIRHDASEHDMWYMNFNDKKLNRKKMPKEVEKVYDAFCEKHEKHDRVMNLIFNDPNYWKNEVNAQNLNYHLFKLASNLQSTELRHNMTLYDIFTEDELYENWLQTNAWWYINYGPCALNGGIAPYSQRNLLRVMIEEADSCLKLSHPGATLRYGHEVCVMPLVCLLEMNNYGKQYADLEQLATEGWNCYDIFPMGCNVQLIFYKPKKGKGDILVKAMLNENETTLPLKAVSGPYYKWNDFRDYFMRKLNNYTE